MLSLWRQALARLAEEIAKSGIPEGSRKINGKYIHTHLVTRLKGTIMLFIYPNISTTSIWFACVLMDNCTLMQFLPLLYPYWCNSIVAFIAVHEQLNEQIKGVDAAQSKEVSVFWVGMAEVNIYARIYFQISRIWVGTLYHGDCVLLALITICIVLSKH